MSTRKADPKHTSDVPAWLVALGAEVHGDAAGVLARHRARCNGSWGLDEMQRIAGHALYIAGEVAGKRMTAGCAANCFNAWVSDPEKQPKLPASAVSRALHGRFGAAVASGSADVDLAALAGSGAVEWDDSGIPAPLPAPPAGYDGLCDALAAVLPAECVDYCTYGDGGQVFVVAASDAMLARLRAEFGGEIEAAAQAAGLVVRVAPPGFEPDS